MKYTIPAIDQRAALALGDVDLIDCHLLQWLFYFCNSKSEALERTQQGVWVSYDHLVAELPLLGLQRRAIGTRLAELCVKKYITLHTNRGKRKTYVKLLSKVEQLFGDTPGQSNREPAHLDASARSQRTRMPRPTHLDASANASRFPDQYHNINITKNSNRNKKLLGSKLKAPDAQVGPTIDPKQQEPNTIGPGYRKALAAAQALRERRLTLDSAADLNQRQLAVGDEGSELSTG